MWEGYNVAWSRTYGNHNIYKPIKTVNTGNKIADYVLGTLAGSLNFLGSGLNIISNGIGTSLELQYLGIEYLDRNIQSYLTATGSFRQDLDAMAFIGLTNPILMLQLGITINNTTNYKLFAKKIKTPSDLARAYQGHGDYPGIDTWTDTIYTAGSEFYRGSPNGTDFWTTKAAVENAGRDSKTLFNGLQVKPSKRRPVLFLF